MAIAEFQDNGEPSADSLAYEGFDQAVKVSLFLKGVLYKGALGNAGLIAGQLLHMENIFEQENPDGLLTVEGVNQCLEHLISGLNDSDRQPYLRYIQEENLRERFRMLLRSEDTELTIYEEIVHDVFTQLAVAVASTISLMLQPDITVIGGLLGVMNSRRFVELESAIQRSRLPRVVANNTVIRLGRYATQNAAAIGANYYFLQSYLRESSSSPLVTAV